MKATRLLLVLFALAVVMAGVAQLLLTERDAMQGWEMRKVRFQEAAARAEPLILAINAYTSDIGHYPQVPGRAACYRAGGVQQLRIPLSHA